MRCEEIDRPEPPPDKALLTSTTLAVAHGPVCGKLTRSHGRRALRLCRSKAAVTPPAPAHKAASRFEQQETQLLALTENDRIRIGLTDRCGD